MHHSHSFFLTQKTPNLFSFYLLGYWLLFLQSITLMAFTAIRSSISLPNMIVCDMPDNTSKDRFSFRQKSKIYKGKRDLQEHLTVTNVASPLPVIAPPPEERPPMITGDREHHVAWTSIPQERWEGELLVQGQLPLWLVSGVFYAKIFFTHN